MRRSSPAGITINGWSIFLHPLFIAQLEELLRQVERLRKRDPKGYVSRNATKRLAAIRKLAFEVIPHDPGGPEYRQGAALGPGHTHWFRAKFFQQYRLFFRYDARSRVIVYAWVNDEHSKRAYGSKSDAYSTFKRMLQAGQPPDDFATLFVEAKAADARRVFSGDE